jgi:hypothetical protein
MQVSKEHYNFETYTDLRRWVSYWNQIREVLNLNPKSVLIIGSGDGVVSDYLKKHVDTVHTFDVASDLKPDIQGSVLDIDTHLSQKYDVILCCQVLEHLPYENFEKVLAKIQKFSTHLILSLPYSHTNILEIFFRLPRSISFYFNLVLPKFYKTWEFDGEHYWEIGAKSCSKKLIQNSISRYFVIRSKYHVEFNRYHIFYICDSL